MPRLTRLTLPGELHIVAQRGHGNQPVFVDDEDRRAYLDALRAACAAHGVAVHAYALLDDEVQWLATPSGEDSLGRAVQAIGQRFVVGFNRRHGLRGTRWEGRFRSAVVDGESHALDLMTMLEQEPVVRGLTGKVSGWPWSSALHHLGTSTSPWLRDHPAVWALGNTPFEREAAYEARLAQALDPGLRLGVRQALLRGWVIGPPGYQKRLEQTMNLRRAMAPRPRGRPARANE